jgi:hypothetical protein
MSSATPRLRRCFLGLVFTGLALRGADSPPPTKGIHAQATEMTPEQLAEKMKGQKAYEFDVAKAELVTAEGSRISLTALPKYLAEQAPAKDAYYILWITAESPPLDELSPIIKAFAEYGITNIVVRPRPGVTPKAGGAEKKTLVLQGKPHADAIDASKPFPNLQGRPEELRPGALPPRVRYVFGSDAKMKENAQRLETKLLGETPGTGPLLGDNVAVYPGAWKALNEAGKIAFKEVKPINMVTTATGGQRVTLLGGHLSTAADLALLEVELRKLIRTEGGGGVRALRTREMARWWPFIAFDILEPTLVLETKGGKYCFILHFSKDRVIMVDELNHLPGKL